MGGRLSRILNKKSFVVISFTIIIVLLVLIYYSISHLTGASAGETLIDNNSQYTGASNEETTKTWLFSDDNFINLGSVTSQMKIDDLTINASEEKNVNIDVNKTEIDGVTYNACLKLNGMGNQEYRSLAIDVKGSCKIEMVLMSNNETEDRIAMVCDKDEKNICNITATKKGSTAIYNYTGESNTIYIQSRNSGINIYKIRVIYE